MTHVQGVESFRISPDELAKDLKISCACSTSVQPLPGKNSGKVYCTLQTVFLTPPPKGSSCTREHGEGGCPYLDNQTSHSKKFYRSPREQRKEGKLTLVVPLFFFDSWTGEKKGLQVAGYVAFMSTKDNTLVSPFFFFWQSYSSNRAATLALLCSLREQ